MKSVKLSMLIVTLAVLTAPCTFADEHTFDANGTKIYYRNDGAGEPVILIHGYTASGALNWRMPGVVRMLQDDYQVIVPDGRGHGKSAVAVDGKYGIEAVEDVIRLMDHLKIKQAHLVGYSMGGMITLKFATLYPERVKSAVIGGMGWVNPGSMGARGERYAGVSDTMAKVYDGFKELETTADEMKAISIPITAIVGDLDTGQLQRVKRWQEIVPDLSVVYVKDAQHTNCVFKPDFREAIKAFLDQQSGK